MKSLRIICIMVLLPVLGLSQNYSISRKFWSLTSVTGAVQLGANYRYLDGYSNEIYNYQKSSRYYAGAAVNTTSYFLHPSFITLNLGGEYNPMFGKDLYLVIPDQAEIVTVGKFDATLSFFNQKPVNFSVYYHYNDVYANRENLTNIRSNTTSYGGNFAWSNKILPFQAAYMHGKWYETELETGRTFTTLQKNLQTRVDKSFSAYDNSQIVYFHNDYTRDDAEIARTRNVSDNLSMNNTIFFDKKRQYTFISAISGIDQYGSDAFRRIQVDESVNLNLPKRFSLYASYNFYDFSRSFQNINQNSVRTTLHHQLYESLRSGLSLEYNHIRQTYYDETNPKAGVDVNYEKKIPLKGRLMLGGSYNWQRMQHTGESTEMPVQHEQHVLTDGQMTLLNKAYVNVSSVVVWDVTGTIIYQLNLDYVLIEHGNYVEVQRMPGGRIPDKATVFVDYTAMLPGSFKYDVNFISLTASVSLINRLVEVYFRWANQGYSSLETTDFLTLNYFTQTTYGLKLEYKFASGGAEYENYNSTIVPYRLVRYWLQVQGNISGKLTYSLCGNWRTYNLTAENTVQQFIDVIGNLGYQIGPRNNISLELAYRKQVGQQIDLNLLTGRLQYTTQIRQIYIRVGIDVYRKDYLHERTNFMGGFIQVVRNFNWYRK